MKKLLYIFIFFLPAFVWCQEKEFVFYPLTVFEKVSNVDELKSIEKVDKLNKKDFFFTENYKGYNVLFFIKKEKDDWVIYQLELYLGANYSFKNIKEENNRFVSIQFSLFPSGMCSNIYGVVFLLDVIRNESIYFYNFNEQECYNEYAEAVSNSECKATFSIKGNILQVKSTKKPDDGLYCIESGTYYYESGKFIKDNKEK